MSNLLFATVPIEQQETIIGGVKDISDINALAIGEGNKVSNNITILSYTYNFFFFRPSFGKKNRRSKF
ncbi:hypothetical protein [Dolichospermum sp. LEGE 00246]|uniref:hypothetical protein n=1 Tax=Dolichospermum sp. LEGE 00246 TaxID=1828605 RepID=UPI00187F159B|nr:hypothetical protein [Dolichospermum sp. LEGE 00246]MBE9260069.1 hypothetical protein [Dolichospermum sp. LEGE 00246]